MAGFLSNAGTMIRAPLGGFYDGADLACCCDSCCCLDQYWHGIGDTDDFTCVITGAVGGTGTLVNVEPDNGYCLQWEGNVTLSTTCGGSFGAAGALVTFRCPIGSSDPQDLEITVVWGTTDPAVCVIVPLGADPIVPDAGATCTPLDVTYTDRWETNTVGGAGCGCGDAQPISINIFA